MISQDPLNSNNIPAYLAVREWAAVVAILGFLMLLTCVVADGRYDSRLNAEPGVHLKPQQVEVFIEGAVRNPGSYRVKIGTLVKDAIALAEPLAEADVRKIRNTSKVRSGQSIVVAKRQMLKIKLYGAVSKEGPLLVPKGTRLCELAELVNFSEDADLKKFTQRRYLKDGEEITVERTKRQ